MVRLIAHRGGAADAPENTLAAFRQAAAAGIRSWELDVQLSRDGVPVVFHDDALDRTSTGHGALAARTLAELRALDAGSWFGPRWSGEHIPLLAEVLNLACGTLGGAPVHLFIELKSPHLYPGIEARVLEAIDEAAYRPHVTLMSFDAHSLVRVRSLAPGLPLCYLVGRGPLRVQRPPARAEAIGPLWARLVANPLPIWQAHRARRQIYTWTVNSLPAARLLRAWGVDGIISDRLDLLRSLT